MAWSRGGVCVDGVDPDRTLLRRQEAVQPTASPPSAMIQAIISAAAELPGNDTVKANNNTAADSAAWRATIDVLVTRTPDRSHKNRAPAAARTTTAVAASNNPAFNGWTSAPASRRATSASDDINNIAEIARADAAARLPGKTDAPWTDIRTNRAPTSIGQCS